MTKNTLLRSAAIGAVLTFGMGVAAHAEDQKAADCVQKCEHAPHHKHHVAPKKPVESPLVGEVAALKAEVAALEQRLDASNAAAQQAQASAQAAQASAQQAQAAAQNDQLAINQIPGDVQHAVAALPKPATDGWNFKGVKFTPGGFIAAESVYRSRGMGADASLPFSAVPYDNTSLKSAHTSEWRQTARQSRVSGKAEANVSDDIKLTAYGEFDFLGAAQTANSNESNSYNLRIRHLYAMADFKAEGVSLLAGQYWSLATANQSGVGVDQNPPATIDAQYVPGFVWARQPEIRVIKNFGEGITAALSVETPQTNKIGGTAVLAPGYGNVTFNQAAQGGSLFNSANSYSFNEVPDVIGKVAFDKVVAGHKLHVEGFGMYRDFYDRVGTGCTTAGTTTTCTAYQNDNTQGGGGGGTISGQILPNLLDGQFSAAIGKGIGRYGSGQNADVFENSNGELDGLGAHMWLAGLTLHATPKLDIYGYAGREFYDSVSYSVAGKAGGYGNPLFSNAGGCELGAAQGQVACTGNAKDAEQLTLGFWDKIYSGDFGSFRFGMQYSYSKVEAWTGETSATTWAAPKGDDNMIYTSIRYYPFQK